MDFFSMLNIYTSKNSKANRNMIPPTQKRVALNTYWVWGHANRQTCSICLIYSLLFCPHFSSSPSHLDCWQDPVPVWCCVYINRGPRFFFRAGPILAAQAVRIWSVFDFKALLLWASWIISYNRYCKNCLKHCFITFKSDFTSFSRYLHGEILTGRELSCQKV